MGTMLTPKQAAQRAGVTYSAIQYWLREGYIPRHVADNGYYIQIDQADLDEHIAGRHVRKKDIGAPLLIKALTAMQDEPRREKSAISFTQNAYKYINYIEGLLTDAGIEFQIPEHSFEVAEGEEHDCGDSFCDDQEYFRNLQVPTNVIEAPSATSAAPVDSSQYVSINEAPPIPKPNLTPLSELKYDDPEFIRRTNEALGL